MAYLLLAWVGPQPLYLPVGTSGLINMEARVPAEHDSMMASRIEELLDIAGSKFSLVTLASRRARQHIANAAAVSHERPSPFPNEQVTEKTAKPLTRAFAEIAAGKVIPGDADVIAAAEAQAAADAAALEAEFAKQAGEPNAEQSTEDQTPAPEVSVE